MSGKFLTRLYHFSWYALATIIILAAVSITLLRIALPDIGQYREDIQLWVSNYMGYPVEIRNINADWSGWIPNLYLEGIKIINNETNSPLISFNQARITLDPLSSLKKQEVIPHSIRVSGLDLSLIRHVDGTVSLIETVNVPADEQDSPTSYELGKWFRNQKRIEINNVSIQWVDEKNELEPVQFNNASIRVHSDGDRMQISGSATADQTYEPTRLQYALDIYGHLHTTRWSGEVYLSADGIDAGYWSKYLGYDATGFGSSPGQIHLWTEWKDTRLI
ncbi:MAG: AsmA family protein, partial [Thiotrichales bacterium]|nr:AsmA family protein [Thiotrichales bacterium]